MNTNKLNRELADTIGPPWQNECERLSPATRVGRSQQMCQICGLVFLLFFAIRSLPVAAQVTHEQRAALSSIARGQSISNWPSPADAPVRALHAKAEAYLTNYQRYHQPYGLTADILFSSRDRATVAKRGARYCDVRRRSRRPI